MSGYNEIQAEPWMDAYEAGEGVRTTAFTIEDANAIARPITFPAGAASVTVALPHAPAVATHQVTFYNDDTLAYGVPLEGANDLADGVSEVVGQVTEVIQWVPSRNEQSERYGPAGNPFTISFVGTSNPIVVDTPFALPSFVDGMLVSDLIAAITPGDYSGSVGPYSESFGVYRAGVALPATATTQNGDEVRGVVEDACVPPVGKDLTGQTWEGAPLPALVYTAQPSLSWVTGDLVVTEGTPNRAATHTVTGLARMASDGSYVDVLASMVGDRIPSATAGVYRLDMSIKDGGAPVPSDTIYFEPDWPTAIPTVFAALGSQTTAAGEIPAGATTFTNADTNLRPTLTEGRAVFPAANSLSAPLANVDLVGKMAILTGTVDSIAGTQDGVFSLEGAGGEYVDVESGNTGQFRGRARYGNVGATGNMIPSKPSNSIPNGLGHNEIYTLKFEADRIVVSHGREGVFFVDRTPGAMTMTETHIAINRLTASLGLTLNAYVLVDGDDTVQQAAINEMQTRYGVIGPILSVFYARDITFAGDSIKVGIASDNSNNEGFGEQSQNRLLTFDYDKNPTLADAQMSPFGETDQAKIDASFANVGTVANFEERDIASIHFGVNDFRRDVPIGTISDATDQTFHGAMYVGLDRLMTSEPNLRVLMTTPFYMQDEDTPNAAGHVLEDYRVAMRAFAARHGVTLIEMGGLWDATTVGTMTTDGLHPNQAGHTLGADTYVAGILATPPVVPVVVPAGPQDFLPALATGSVEALAETFDLDAELSTPVLAASIPHTAPANTAWTLSGDASEAFTVSQNGGNVEVHLRSAVENLEHGVRHQLMATRSLNVTGTPADGTPAESCALAINLTNTISGARPVPGVTIATGCQTDRAALTLVDHTSAIPAGWSRNTSSTPPTLTANTDGATLDGHHVVGLQVANYIRDNVAIRNTYIELDATIGAVSGHRPVVDSRNVAVPMIMENVTIDMNPEVVKWAYDGFAGEFGVCSNVAVLGAQNDASDPTAGTFTNCFLSTSPVIIFDAAGTLLTNTHATWGHSDGMQMFDMVGEALIEDSLVFNTPWPFREGAEIDYIAGTVASAPNGQAIATGSGTLWQTGGANEALNVGDIVRHVGASYSYVVTEVISDTQIRFGGNAMGFIPGQLARIPNNVDARSPVTAALFLQGVRAGGLDLDAPIRARNNIAIGASYHMQSHNAVQDGTDINALIEWEGNAFANSLYGNYYPGNDPATRAINNVELYGGAAIPDVRPTPALATATLGTPTGTEIPITAAASTGSEGIVARYSDDAGVTFSPWATVTTEIAGLTEGTDYTIEIAGGVCLASNGNYLVQGPAVTLTATTDTAAPAPLMVGSGYIDNGQDVYILPITGTPTTGTTIVSSLSWSGTNKTLLRVEVFAADGTTVLATFTPRDGFDATSVNEIYGLRTLDVVWPAGGVTMQATFNETLGNLYYSIQDVGGRVYNAGGEHNSVQLNGSAVGEVTVSIPSEPGDFVIGIAMSNDAYTAGSTEWQIVSGWQGVSATISGAANKATASFADNMPTSGVTTYTATYPEAWRRMYYAVSAYR